jgi:uncharacterized protein YjeT (DUF2065 family)
MWHDLLAALGLLLVLEGLIPFWKPQTLRQMLEMLAQLDDRSIRIAGVASMAAGLLLLYLVRN